MDSAAETSYDDIKDLTTKRMNNLKNNCKAADGRLDKKINDKDTRHGSQFLLPP